MRNISLVGLSSVAIAMLTMGTGCAGSLVQPGHRGLYFDPTMEPEAPAKTARSVGADPGELGGVSVKRRATGV